MERNRDEAIEHPIEDMIQNKVTPSEVHDNDNQNIDNNNDYDDDDVQKAGEDAMEFGDADLAEGDEDDDLRGKISPCTW